MSKRKHSVLETVYVNGVLTKQRVDVQLFCTTRRCTEFVHRSGCKKCLECCERSSSDCAAVVGRVDAESVSSGSATEAKQSTRSEVKDSSQDGSMDTDDDSR